MSSVYLDCATEAQSIIQGLDLTGLDDDQIVLRKFPHLRDDDTKPIVIVSTHQATTQTPATNTHDDITYPVAVSLWAAANGDLVSNLNQMLAWREDIRQAFHQKPLENVSGVWMCLVPASAPFNEAWFVMGQQDQCQITLNFISREARD